jgi:hypothetical protein
MDVNSDGFVTWEEFNVFVAAIAKTPSMVPAPSLPPMAPSSKPNQPLPGGPYGDPLHERPVGPSKKSDATSGLSSTSMFVAPTAPARSPSAVDQVDEDDIEKQDPLSTPFGPEPSGRPTVAPRSVDADRPHARNERPNGVVPDRSDHSTSGLGGRRGTQSEVRDHRVPSMATWRVRDVTAWLCEDLELPQYSEAFSIAAVDGPMLLTLTDTDLRDELGVASMLHRRKVLRAVASRSTSDGSAAEVPEKPRRAKSGRRSGSKRRTHRKVAAAVGMEASGLSRVKVREYR